MRGCCPRAAGIYRFRARMAAERGGLRRRSHSGCWTVLRSSLRNRILRLPSARWPVLRCPLRVPGQANVSLTPSGQRRHPTYVAGDVLAPALPLGGVGATVTPRGADTANSGGPGPRARAGECGEGADSAGAPELQGACASGAGIGRLDHDRTMTSAVRGGVWGHHLGIPTGLKTQPLRPNWAGPNWRLAGSNPISATASSSTYGRRATTSDKAGHSSRALPVDAHTNRRP